MSDMNIFRPIRQKTGINPGNCNVGVNNHRTMQDVTGEPHPPHKLPNQPNRDIFIRRNTQK